MNSININDSSNNEVFNQIPLKINGEDVIVNNLSFQIPQIDSDEENPVIPSNYINVQRALEGFSNKINNNTENISQNTEDIAKNIQNIENLNSAIAEITGGMSGQFQRDSALITDSEGHITYSSEATSADIAKLSGLNELLNTDDFYKSTLAGALQMLNSKTESSKRVLIDGGEQNLDTYLNAGQYYFSSKCTLVNQPNDVPDVINGHLIVLSGQQRLTNLTYCKQIFLRGSDNNIKTYQAWERTYNAIASEGASKYGWSPWVRYLTTADDVSGGKQETIVVTETGTDLNNYKTEGRYLFTSSYKPLNIPQGEGGILVVYKTTAGGTGCKQFWFRIGTTGVFDHKIFIRQTATATEWGPWIRILTEKDFNDKITINGTSMADLQFHTDNGGNAIIRAYDVDVNGKNLLIQSNGGMIVGGGEGATTAYNNNLNNCATATESLYFPSDSAIHAYTKINSIQNVTDATEASDFYHWQLTTSGQIILPNYFKLATADRSTKGPRISPDGNILMNVENGGVQGWLSTILNNKQAKITGAASTVATSNLTASRALVSNSSGKVAVSAVTSTELDYLDGVTSNIQTQLNGKATTTQVNAKAPTNHASTATTYGVGTINNYGHLKIANNLSTSSFDANAPVALSAYQGKLLNDKITTLTNKVPTFSITGDASVNDVAITYGTKKVLQSITLDPGTYIIEFVASLKAQSAINSDYAHSNGWAQASIESPDYSTGIIATATQSWPSLWGGSTLKIPVITMAIRNAQTKYNFCITFWGEVYDNYFNSFKRVTRYCSCRWQYFKIK